jgi:DNA-binding transcriptional regulator YdaS (Cro superfamily)
MKSIREIVEAFGGPRPMARLLGYPPSTVMSWARRDIVPSRHIPVILRAAEKKGIKLAPADFFEAA